jgi:DNA mismatch repair protein MutH
MNNFTACGKPFCEYSNLIQPPQSVSELILRAESMAGKTIKALISELNQKSHGNIIAPDNLQRKKGWQGQFIETYLGADSGNLSQPDFQHLDIELKTLPIDNLGRVQESTYVCVVNLKDNRLESWQESIVYNKLKQVLWVPIAKQPNKDTELSVIATPFLWQANEIELNRLKADWEYVMEKVNLGEVDQLTARDGEILQVRPKAANASVTTKTIGPSGKMIDTLPRGFYLRSKFTQSLLNQYLKVF